MNKLEGIIANAYNLNDRIQTTKCARKYEASLSLTAETRACPKLKN